MDKHNLDVVSAEKNTAKIQKAICSGFFRNFAKRDDGDDSPRHAYKTLVNSQIVYIHPSSGLFKIKPEW